MEEVKWLEEKSWEEFQSTGLLWFINRTLHLFGWVITVDCELDENNKITKINRAYPARCKFRGFKEKEEEEGFKHVSRYLKENIEELEKDTQL
jgi:hypothetical protein